MSTFLNVAFDAIKAAGKVTLSHYTGQIRSRTKIDGSPVTSADLKSEYVIRNVISKRFPDHGFYGEEYGHTNADSEYCWLIDPIDGTKNYISRIPLWGTLIALMKHDEIVLGVSHIPLQDELLWAEKGKGAFLNGKRVRVSKVEQLSESMISFGSLPAFKKRRMYTPMLKLMDACKRQRSFGDLWPYHLLASGKLDIVTEASIKPVDIAPFVVICNEAGGETSDLKGHPFSLSIQSFLATNSKLHSVALKYFIR